MTEFTLVATTPDRLVYGDKVFDFGLVVDDPDVLDDSVIVHFDSGRTVFPADCRLYRVEAS